MEDRDAAGTEGATGAEAMPISIGDSCGRDSSSGRDSGCRINGNGSEGDVNDETACCRSE